MKKQLFKHVTLLSLLAILFFTLSCSPRYVKPIFLSESFNHKSIDNIYVLPFVDFRISEEISEESKVDINRLIQKWIKTALKDRNYKFKVIDNLTITENITIEDLENIDISWVKQLGPERARWIFLPVLGFSESKLGLITAGKAEMTGYLFDKENGMKIWYNKKVHEEEMGGLWGLALASSLEKDAIMLATVFLMQGFPKRD
jgi:hypothetical protein